MGSQSAAPPRGRTDRQSFYPHVFPQLLFVLFVLIPLTLIDKERSARRPWLDRIFSRRRIWARGGGGIVIFTNVLGSKATRKILDLVGIEGRP